MSSHSSWIRPSVTPAMLDYLSNKVADAIKKDIESGVKIEAIAVRGCSGLVMGGVVSFKTGIPLIIVRKEDENRHSDLDVESSIDKQSFTYAVIDDFVSTGETVRQIISKINHEFEDASLFGVYCYWDYSRANEKDYYFDRYAFEAKRRDLLTEPEYRSLYDKRAIPS